VVGAGATDAVHDPFQVTSARRPAPTRFASDIQRAAMLAESLWRESQYDVQL